MFMNTALQWCGMSHYDYCSNLFNYFHIYKIYVVFLLFPRFCMCCFQ